MTELLEPDFIEVISKKSSVSAERSGVKVLSENVEGEYDFEKSKDEIGHVPVNEENLSDEFKGLLQMN
jgi:hypothetical protein